MRRTGDPPEPSPAPERALDHDYYRDVTVEATIWQTRLELLELGCTWRDIQRIDADDAERLLATAAGKRQAKAEVDEAAWDDAKRARNGSMAPRHAWNDPAFWNFGDTSTWGGTDGPPTQAVWVARDEQGNPLGPVEPWMLDYGLPPE